MAIEATIKTLLGALVSGRCYPLVNDSPTIVLPYITFQLVYAEQNIGTHEYDRYQIDVWAATFSGAKTLAGTFANAVSMMNSIGGMGINWSGGNNVPWEDQLNPSIQGSQAWIGI